MDDSFNGAAFRHDRQLEWISLLLYIIAVDNIYVNKKILTVSLFVPGPPAGGSGQVGQHRWRDLGQDRGAGAQQAGGQGEYLLIYTLYPLIYVSIYLLLISTSRPTPGRPSSPSMALTRASTGSGSGCPALRTPWETSARRSRSSRSIR